MYTVICRDNAGLIAIVRDDAGEEPFIAESIDDAVKKRDYMEKRFAQYPEQPKYKVMMLTEVSHEPLCNKD